MKSQEKNKKESCPKRGITRTYRLSPEAVKVLDTAKQEKARLDDFVSLCVIEHGKIVLGQKFPLEQVAPLESRLKYLEAAVDCWLYCEFEEEFKKANVAKAHLSLLKKTAPAVWYGNLKKMLAAAKKNSLTKNTEPHEWRALIRMKEEFFKESEEEE